MTRKFDLADEVYADILNSPVWAAQGIKVKIEEKKEEQKADQKAVNESTEVESDEEVHTCPLCESQLETAISDERIQEHIDYVLDVVNETIEALNESEEDEVEGDEQESEESEED